MPKKLSIDSLFSEIASVKELLSSAKQSGDFVGEMQLDYRLQVLTERLSSLEKSSLGNNSASVALFFGGKPVLGSKGIAAEFAGTAIEQFQDLISKIFATKEVGELGERGRVPFKSQSELMVTGVVRGSFGFVLNEMSNQTELEDSELTYVIDKATHLLRDVSSQDEAVFENIIEELNPRTLASLKNIFSNLDASQATLRVVEKNMDILLDSSAVRRGKTRTEDTSIEEKNMELDGVLVGFLPEHRKFEIRNKMGDLVYGSATAEAVEQFHQNSNVVIGEGCLASVNIKTVSPLSSSPKEIVNLIEFLDFG